MKRQSVIHVENIKCGGCANSITSKLKDQQGVLNVEIDLEEGTVILDHENDIDLGRIQRTLAQMGYPLTGENNFGAKAKSYVSCMVGRMSD